MELTKLNTMDEINISLPCGFSAKYKDIFYNNDKFPCPVCKIHDLTSQECLNMTKNKILLNEIKLDQKKNQYEELMKEFENYKNDPKHFIDESFDCLKREVDLRREEIKLMLNKEIDDYHDGLLEKIDMERDLKLKVIEERIQNTELFDLASFKIDENLDIHSKLEFYSKGKIKIDNGIRSLTNLIYDLKNLKFKLTESCVNIDIKKLFGELEWKEKANTLQKRNHIDKMDNLIIYLPCGFSAKYKDITYNNGKFPCPVCKIHDLSSQECLSMTKNKILLNEIKLDQKKNQYEELLIKFENYKNDPKHYIDESFDCLKREVDLRREEIKLMLNKEIDDYHDGLLEKIDMERDLKLKVIEERIQNTELFDLASFKIDENLDIHSKLEFYSKGKIKIDNGIRWVTNLIDDLKNLKFKLTESSVNIDIKKLFGELNLKEENKNLTKGKQINEMDDVNIILPCGLSAKYKDIFYNFGKFRCPACKAHDLTSEECLNMIRNRLVLTEKSCELDKSHYVELMIEFESYKNEPKQFIDECYESLKRKVYLRKEEIKVLIRKKIDVYQHGLLKKIDTERDIKLKELEEKIQKITTLDLAILDFDKNLDIHSQLDFHKNNKLKIRNAIKSVQNILDDFKEPKFKLVNRNVDICLKKLFGELYPVEETIFILSEDEFSNESRAEATIQLIINNLSQLKYRNNFRIRSKKCFIRNFEWHIWIEINEENGLTGFYLTRSSMEESNEFSVNVTAVLSLVNKSDPNQSLNKTLTHLFTVNDSWGYLLATMDEIMNPASGYYDANDDSITLKAVIKAELPQKNS